MYLKRVLLIPARRERVIKSPRLAAMGVATLSGFIPTFLAPMITPIITRPREDTRSEIRHEGGCSLLYTVPWPELGLVWHKDGEEGEKRSALHMLGCCAQ